MSVHEFGDRPLSRREFLKTAGRLGGVGLLVWLGASLSQRQSSPSDNQVCGNQGWCRPCPQVADCILPRALSFRRES